MDEFIGERRDLARGRCRVVAFKGQATRLRCSSEGDALAYGGGEERRIVIGQRLGRLASDDGARGAAIENEAGDELSEGSINPNDILKIKGAKGVQAYLLKDVTMVNRLQGVQVGACSL